MQPQEKILVVPQNIIEPLLTSVPFSPANFNAIFSAILANYTWVDRTPAETNESIKQIIPYVMCRHEGKYYMTQRTKKQGEQRLHGKWSLGVGGHINTETDVKGYLNIVEASLFRELDEEVCMSSRHITPVGVLYDPTTPVGRVHVGLAYVLDTLAPEFTVREPEEHINAQWAGLEDIRKVYSGLEDWSRILFDQYISKA